MLCYLLCICVVLMQLSSFQCGADTDTLAGYQLTSKNSHAEMHDNEVDEEFNDLSSEPDPVREMSYRFRRNFRRNDQRHYSRYRGRRFAESMMTLYNKKKISEKTLDDVRRQSAHALSKSLYVSYLTKRLLRNNVSDFSSDSDIKDSIKNSSSSSAFRSSMNIFLFIFTSFVTIKVIDIL